MDLEGFKKWLIERGRDEGTAKGYLTDVRLALDHPTGPLGRLRSKTLAPKTLRRIVAGLRAWCKYTKDNHLLEQISDIRLPPPARKVAKIPLSKEQWAKLIGAVDSAEYINNPERVVIGMMLCKGLRVGDVLRITREDVDKALASGVLNYKGKRSKRIETGISGVIEYLKFLTKQPEWVTIIDLLVDPTSKNPEKTAAQKVSRALKAVGKKIGISPKELYPHRLRRTFATWFLEETGGNLEKLREVMSWESISTAAGYAEYNRRGELDKLSEDMLKKIKKTEEDKNAK